MMKFRKATRQRGGGSLWRLALLLTVFSSFGCSIPDIQFADGQDARWSEWAGKWIGINYGAEWCKPCRVEIPELNRMHREGAAAGVVVLGVNFDGVTGPGLQTLIGKFAIEFPVLLADPGARWGQSTPSILPATLVIDPEGKLHDVLVGPQTFETLAEAVGIEPAG